MSMILALLVWQSLFAVEVLGHGYMFKPINRASRWRLDPENWSLPHDYEDNQFFCGGFSVQYYLNGGKCGPCGDNWNDTVPRSNENGGTYGNGVVVAWYSAGDMIETNIVITANHLGYISYQLCKLADPDLPETEECFQSLPLADGTYRQPIGPNDYNITSYVQLPKYLICSRCVLRWHYSAGNNWGSCGNGTAAKGCGIQETFRSCADISIIPKGLFGLFKFKYNN